MAHISPFPWIIVEFHIPCLLTRLTALMACRFVDHVPLVHRKLPLALCKDQIILRGESQYVSGLRLLDLSWGWVDHCATHAIIGDNSQ